MYVLVSLLTLSLTARADDPATADATASPKQVPWTAADSPGGHCTAAEQVILSCEIEGKAGKVLSLCASKEVTATTGWMAYRFGALGAVELEVPSTPAPPPATFAYATESEGPQISHSTWTFTNEGHTFVVHDSFFHGEQENGLTITLPDGREVPLSCTQPAINHFGALYALYPQTGSP